MTEQTEVDKKAATKLVEAYQELELVTTEHRYYLRGYTERLEELHTRIKALAKEVEHEVAVNEGTAPNEFWWLDVNNKPEQPEHDQVIEEKLES